MLIGLVSNDLAIKNAVAWYLLTCAGFREASIEEPVRTGLKAMFGLADNDFHPDRLHTPIEWLGKSPYQLVQSLATDWGRHSVSRQVWNIQLANALKPMLRCGQDVVIPDVQFVADAEMVHRLGGQIWRVHSPHYTPDRAAIYTSEQEQARLVEDLTLINDGTQEQLFESIDDALCDWFARGGDLEVTHLAAA